MSCNQSCSNCSCSGSISKPVAGSRWTHRNGNVYTVVCLTNEASNNEADYPVSVVYQGPNGNVWSRLLSDWHRSMTLIAPEVESLSDLLRWIGQQPLDQFHMEVLSEQGVDEFYIVTWRDRDSGQVLTAHGLSLEVALRAAWSLSNQLTGALSPALPFKKV